jgi:hypothetical protein
MKTANLVYVIATVTIIALGGGALAPASLLTQSAIATNAMTTTTVGELEEGTISGATTASSNSNVTLGNLFYIARGVEETFNPVNETYFVISYVDSVTLMPPNATSDTVINATERGNFTVTILPNGLSINQGQGIITTEGGGQEESATAIFTSLGRTDAEGTTGSSTGAVFFSTNSTGQLAFLNNMVGIAQVEFSPEESTVRIWEWKGGTLPIENGVGAPTMGNQTLSP